MVGEVTFTFSGSLNEQSVTLRANSINARLEQGAWANVTFALLKKEKSIRPSVPSRVPFTAALGMGQGWGPI